jgi:hypothetical protein
MYATYTEVLKAWEDSINGKNLSGVLGLYSRNSVLVPTFSSHTLKAPKDRRDYFKKLFLRPGLNVEMHPETLAVHRSGKLSLLSGFYQFHAEVDSVAVAFPSRFTMVLSLRSSHPILQHHSSQMPRDL